MDLFYSLRAPYRRSAVFLTNDATMKALRQLKNGNGDYIWQPSVTAGTPDTILNRPVYTSTFMPTIAAGAKTIIFADPKGYTIKATKSVEITILREKFATKNMLGIMAYGEYDGKVTDGKRIVALKQKAS